MQVCLAGLLPNSNGNGPGLRKVFFFQGCKHHCKGCFNPHTGPMGQGQWFDCDELIKPTLDETYLAGITFSGGDPFYQPQALRYMAKAFHSANLSVGVYTGFTWRQLLSEFRSVLSHIDVVVDGPFVEKLKDETLGYAGSSNQRCIDVQKSLKCGKIILYEGKI